MLEPFLPFTAEKIWSTLNMEGSIHDQRWQGITQEIPPGHTIAKPQPLFLKIEDKTIQKQKLELKESLEAVGAKPQITMEEFKKNDLRIGKIVDAERVKGSDKLLKLFIDIGERSIKQAISGIAQQYAVEELKGKEVAVIVNLKPTKIFNVESEVMILAAEDGKKIIILQPNQSTTPGSKIR